jgi:hypothetical protein
VPPFELVPVAVTGRCQVCDPESETVKLTVPLPPLHPDEMSSTTIVPSCGVKLALVTVPVPVSLIFAGVWVGSVARPTSTPDF